MTSSSDDEYDFYGQATKRLQELKSNYKEKEVVEEVAVESEDDSEDIFKRIAETDEKNKKIEEEIIKYNLLPLNDTKKTGKGVSRHAMTTRNSKRTGTLVINNESCAPVPKPTRKKKIQKEEETVTSTTEPLTSPPPSKVAKTKTKAAKQKKKKTPNRRRRGWFPQMPRGFPTITFDEEFADIDKSAGIPLFSRPDTNNHEDNVQDLSIGEDDFTNEEVSVKVFWQSRECVKFNLRMHQKLKPIFEFFCEREKVPLENLYMAYCDKRFSVDDTPDSIKYNIAKFIDGGIVTRRIATEQKLTAKGIPLKFQIQNQKKPLEIRIDKNELLQLAFVKCSEQLEKPIASLRFMFDGEVLNPKSTPADLEMEGGECIDVKLLNT